MSGEGMRPDQRPAAAGWNDLERSGCLIGATAALVLICRMKVPESTV